MDLKEQLQKTAFADSFLITYLQPTITTTTMF